jgi:hypothetical protein
LTSTCRAAGDGMGRFSIRNTPGGPYRSYTTARIRLPPNPLMQQTSLVPEASSASGLTPSVARRDKRSTKERATDGGSCARQTGPVRVPYRPLTEFMLAGARDRRQNRMSLTIFDAWRRVFACRSAGPR